MVKCRVVAASKQLYEKFQGDRKMKTKKLIFYVLAGILAGCVPVASLYPLYTKEDAVFEKKLLGTWVDDQNNPETTWEFKCPNEPEKVYKLVFSDDEGKKGSFDVYLVKLEKLLFLDVYPNRSPCKEEDLEETAWPYNGFFLVPTHTFIKIDSIEPTLKIRLTDDDELKKLLKEVPDAVKHELVDGTLILTASTKELQVFVAKYAEDDRLFSKEKEIVLVRKKTKCQQKSPEQDRGESDDIDPNKGR